MPFFFLQIVNVYMDNATVALLEMVLATVILDIMDPSVTKVRIPREFHKP